VRARLTFKRKVEGDSDKTTSARDPGRGLPATMLEQRQPCFWLHLFSAETKPVGTQRLRWQNTRPWESVSDGQRRTPGGQVAAWRPRSNHMPQRR